jgi:hypothetical protein
VLPRVAAENETTTTVADVAKKPLHLFASDLAGFIHDDNGSVWHWLSHEEFAHGLNSAESILFQTHDLLSLRREDVDVMPGSLQPIADLSQGVAFPSARAAAKQREKVAGTQDVLDSRALF